MSAGQRFREADHLDYLNGPVGHDKLCSCFVLVQPIVPGPVESRAHGVPPFAKSWLTWRVQVLSKVDWEWEAQLRAVQEICQQLC